MGQGTRKALTYAFSRPWESGPLFLDRDGFWGRGLYYRTGSASSQSTPLSQTAECVWGGTSTRLESRKHEGLVVALPSLCSSKRGSD